MFCKHNYATNMTKHWYSGNNVFTTFPTLLKIWILHKLERPGFAGKLEHTVCTLCISWPNHLLGWLCHCYQVHQQVPCQLIYIPHVWTIFSKALGIYFETWIPKDVQDQYRIAVMVRDWETGWEVEISKM